MKPEKKGGQKGRSALPATPPPQKGRIGYRPEKMQPIEFPEIPEILLPDLPPQIPENVKAGSQEGGDLYVEA